jgi:cytoskeletal protein CcmA (bactofilin family)
MVKKSGGLITLLAAVLAISFLLIAPVNAADIRNGERLIIPAGDVINDDLYLFGANITVDGAVNGDVIVFGNRITINGDVNGSIIGAGQDIMVKGRVKDSVRVAASALDINSAIGGDLMAAASRVTVVQSGSVGRDLLAAAAMVQVDGPVSRDIRGSAGKIIINSSVGGNVDIVSDEVKLEPAASIAGNLIYKSEKKAEQAKEAMVKGEIKHVPPPPQPKPSGETIGQAIGGLVSAIVGFIVILLLVVLVIKYAAALLTGIILILLARKYIPGLVETLKSNPWPCLGYGALILFLVPVAITIAFGLVIGIPLGLATLALYMLAVYLGHIFIGLFIGKWMLRQRTDVDSTGRLISALAVGLLIVYLCGIIPFIGCLTDLAVILFGLGTIAYFLKTKLAT